MLVLGAVALEPLGDVFSQRRLDPPGEGGPGTSSWAGAQVIQLVPEFMASSP